MARAWHPRSSSMREFANLETDSDSPSQAHAGCAALPTLLPTPPKWKMLPQLPLPPPPPCVAAKLSKPPPAKPGRADSDERWDARKVKPACPASSASPSSSGWPRSPDSFTSSAGHGSPPRKNATSPPPLMPGRADSVERWDAHKKVGIPASSSSSPGTSSLASSSKWPISRAKSSDKERSPPQDDQRLDDGESNSTGSDNIDTEEEEEILWKPRAMYAGPGFAVAAPKSSMLPMPAAFLVPVA